jgi:hypothetical protein
VLIRQRQMSEAARVSMHSSGQPNLEELRHFANYVSLIPPTPGPAVGLWIALLQRVPRAITAYRPSELVSDWIRDGTQGA